MDTELAHQLNIATETLPHAIHVSALSGQCLPAISHVTLALSGENLLFVLKAPEMPLGLSHPWLQQHNPQINWKKGFMSGWGEECHMNCLRSTTPLNSASNPSLPSESSNLTSNLISIMI